MVIKRSDAAGEKEQVQALAREVGQRGVAQLEASQARLLSEAGPNGRWILGTLVLLNGGGIALTVGSAKDLYPQTISPAMIFFIFGTALALIAALVNAAAPLVMTRLIGAASGHWTEVSVTGDISDAALKSASNVRKQGLIWSAAPLAVGLLSLMLFMTGAMTLADGVAPSAQPSVVSPAEAALANAANAALPVSNAAPVLNAVAQPVPSATPQASQPAPAPQARPAERRVPQRRQQREPAAAPPAQTPVTTPAPAAVPPPAQ
ncbi:MAG: hypothetical protein J7494_11560 [Sphingobium sp.]|nr:hypothetical protein [Sphingobium sp.]